MKTDTTGVNLCCLQDPVTSIHEQHTLPDPRRKHHAKENHILLHCTMCTCGTTIPLYPKLPCICYRGIIEFHCIFAGFWRFMPQIL